MALYQVQMASPSVIIHILSTQATKVFFLFSVNQRQSQNTKRTLLTKYSTSLSFFLVAEEKNVMPFYILSHNI